MFDTLLELQDNVLFAIQEARRVGDFKQRSILLRVSRLLAGHEDTFSTLELATLLEVPVSTIRRLKRSFRAKAFSYECVGLKESLSIAKALQKEQSRTGR